jgi:L-arabinokinase
VNTPLSNLEPVPTLLARTRAELGASFVAGKPIRVSRAPGRLDVMGGIADYTGSIVCEWPLDRAAAVCLQSREDREVQVFSFNLFDEHKPFTLQVPLDALADNDPAALRKSFAEPGRTWAAYLAGGLALLHHRGFINLRDPSIRGVNLAVDSSVPMGAGVSSSAAIEVATLLNLVDHFGLRDRFDPVSLAALAQSVENQIVGAPCGVMDQVTSCAASVGKLLRLSCQPHDLLPPLAVPEGMKFLGIHSGVRHSVGGGDYGRTRCAAFMAHRMILEKMRDFGRAANRLLERDPMNGYLANLDPEDYKKFFRAYLPETIKGGEFLLRFGGTIDTATVVAPDTFYNVRSAADHHVLEAMRVRNFCAHLEEANGMEEADPARGLVLDKAGHLMYGSHLSYTNDAQLGAPECDLLVDLVRKRERRGLYGAKITGGGCGGTVAVLCEANERADAAIADVMVEYAKQSGKKPELLEGTSPGAWDVGTLVTGAA